MTETVGWALCQNGMCPTHTPHAQHHIKVTVLPWERIEPAACPECGGELKLDLIYGRAPKAEEMLEKPAPLPPETPGETLF